MWVKRIASMFLVIGLCCGCESSTNLPVGRTVGMPETSDAVTVSDEVVNNRVVEASCGECQFGLDGDDCNLAIRLTDGSVLMVDGTGIDDHGDAHAASGLCNRIRRARVTGRRSNGRFISEAFELLPETPGRLIPSD